MKRQKTNEGSRGLVQLSLAAAFSIASIKGRRGGVAAGSVPCSETNNQQIRCEVDRDAVAACCLSEAPPERLGQSFVESGTNEQELRTQDPQRASGRDGVENKDPSWLSRFTCGTVNQPPVNAKVTRSSRLSAQIAFSILEHDSWRYLEP